MGLDILIRNGKIIDGTGNPWFRGDVAVEHDVIVDVGHFSQASAATVVDASGKVVCPGFIDMHTHSDLVLLAHPLNEAKLAQGVVTDVIGQDGLSYAPTTDRALKTLRELTRALNGDYDLDYGWRSVGEYLDRFDRKVSGNVAYLVPHAAVRTTVMGMERRAPTSAEMTQMKRLVAEAMEQGCAGFSTGLSYPPCAFADTDELIELCKPAAAYGGYFAPHLRSYGATLSESFEEALTVARGAGIPLHFTHLQVNFQPNRGKAGKYLSIIDQQRAAGLEITMDCYPYTAGSTYLAGLLPSWLQEGGRDMALDRLADLATRERLRRELEAGCDGMHGVPANWSEVILSGVADVEHEGYVGHSIDDASQMAGKDPYTFVFDLLFEEQLAVTCLVENGDEENVMQVARHPAAMAGSDGIFVGTRPHPRAYGAHARWLAEYVRNRQLLGLEECVRKMTSLPASRLGLLDRGLLRKGMAADIVVLDPGLVRDTATYESPRRLAEGVEWVLVNGVVTWQQGHHTGATAGRALKPARH
jgi:N-acyl-D-amino-acid deacylase